MKPNEFPRALDVFLSSLFLLACAPIVVIAAVAIKATSKGPVVFRQARVGKNGEVFHLFKLRSMKIDKAGPLITASGDPRITWVGRFLRKTKIDEVPQLVNVFVGNMSLVGPRPEVPKYVDLQDPGWKVILSVKPGITSPESAQLYNEDEIMSLVDVEYEHFYKKVLQPYKKQVSISYLRRRNVKTDLLVIAQTAWQFLCSIVALGMSAKRTANQNDMVGRLTKKEKDI